MSASPPSDLRADEAETQDPGFHVHNRFGTYWEPDYADGRVRAHFLSIGYRERPGSDDLVAPNVDRGNALPETEET